MICKDRVPTRQQLLSEIKNLSEAETNLEGRKKSLHAEGLNLMFAIGSKIERLKEESDRTFMTDLASIGIPWSTAQRKLKTWQLFGQYQHESWIVNFGKSALQLLAEYYHQKESNQATELVLEAIGYAKQGIEVDTAWVLAKTQGRDREVGKKHSRLSTKVCHAVKDAINRVGEEKVLEALQGLINE